MTKCSNVFHLPMFFSFKTLSPCFYTTLRPSLWNWTQYYKCLYVCVTITNTNLAMYTLNFKVIFSNLNIPINNIIFDPLCSKILNLYSIPYESYRLQKFVWLGILIKTQIYCKLGKRFLDGILMCFNGEKYTYNCE